MLLSLVNSLVCPHCQTGVPDRAGVCTGCGAEIIRGTTGRERGCIGLVFALAAIPVFALIFRALQLRGAVPVPDARNPAALLFLLGVFAFFVCAYFIGAVIGALLWRSKVRFLREYRHR